MLLIILTTLTKSNAEPEDNVKLRNFFSTDKKHLVEGFAEPKDLATN